METWKVIVFIVLAILFALKLIFQIRVDFVQNSMIIYYYSFDKKKRMSIVI